jgi:hypothetical protein
MESVQKIIGVLSCSVVLCLSLSNATQAGVKHDPCTDRKGALPDVMKCEAETRQGIETVKGEVLRIEGDSFVVERFDGKKVSLHIDEATKMGGFIGRGDRIEANVRKVKDQPHVLSIRLIE